MKKQSIIIIVVVLVIFLGIMLATSALGDAFGKRVEIAALVAVSAVLVVLLLLNKRT